MPIYEYQCNTCQHHFEQLVSLHEAAPPCPRCEGETSKKLSSFAISMPQSAPPPTASCGAPASACHSCPNRS